MDKDSLLFDDKSFSDLLRDVYANTKKKETQINALIDSCIGLLSYSKSLKTKGCLKKLLG